MLSMSVAHVQSLAHIRPSSGIAGISAATKHGGSTGGPELAAAEAIISIAWGSIDAAATAGSPVPNPAEVSVRRDMPYIR